jgi:hypothetical protein
MKSEKPKRFFKKRIEEVEEESIETKELPESPQINRPITASILSRFLVFGCYFCILFSFSIVGWSKFSEDEVAKQPIVEALTIEPFSADAHLNYLDFLVKSHRLEEAKDESSFIYYLEPVSKLGEKNAERFDALNVQIAEKSSTFKTVVDSYIYWKNILKSRPDYRDGLYRYSEFSYMLFDEKSSVESLHRSVEIDPQFEVGKRVLSQF